MRLQWPVSKSTLLSTCTPPPHKTEPLVATTSDDGEFRIWSRAGSAAAAATTTPPPRWRCRAAGGYKRRPLGCCAFSPDGSLLAVGAGGAATLWDPRENALLAALPPPAGLGCGGAPGAMLPPPQLTQLAFSAGSPHLAGVLSRPWPGSTDDGSGGDTLVVWDLLTLSVAWSAALPRVAALAADPAAPLFAVAVNIAGGAAHQQQHLDGGGQQQEEDGEVAIEQQQANGTAAAAQHSGGSAAPRVQRHATRRGCVLVFSPSGATPLSAAPLPQGAAAAALCHAPLRTPLGANTTPGGFGTPMLVVTEDRCYTLVARPGAAAAAAGVDAAAQADAVREALGGDESVLEAVFGKASAGTGVTPGAGASGGDARGAERRVAALFDAPSHALPVPSLLAPSLLELLIAGDGGP